MTDTPDHIKKLQLQIWLVKTPEERQVQAIKDNEDMFIFWKMAKSQIDSAIETNNSKKGIRLIPCIPLI